MTSTLLPSISALPQISAPVPGDSAPSFSSALSTCASLGGRLWEPKARSKWVSSLNEMEVVNFGEPFNEEAFGLSELAIGIKYDVDKDKFFYR